MQIPYSKKEFVKIMVTEYQNPLRILFGFFNESSKPDLREFLKSRFGLTCPDLPIINEQRRRDPILYFENLWERNRNYFECNIKLPSGNDPRDRECLMGLGFTIPQVAEWIEKVEKSEEWNNGWFTKRPYHERKYMMLVRGFEDYEKNTPEIMRFRISRIPADIKFESCFPTLNELYIAHPYRPGVYLPASRYENILFRERIHEMSKIMMALGATEIRTLQNDASKSSMNEERSSRTSGSGNIGSWASGSGSYASDSRHTHDNEYESEIVINFKSDPIKKPYIPENLVWFNHESEWQQVADLRLNGNILEYELVLTSKQVNLVSDNERSNIEAQAKILLASGNFSKESSSGSFFKNERARSTSIIIKFKSHKDY